MQPETYSLPRFKRKIIGPPAEYMFPGIEFPGTLRGY
jgi:hypothetical protein